MKSEKIPMVSIRSALFKKALPRQTDSLMELDMEQSMLSAELSDMGARSDKNRKVIHKYFCDKTGFKMPYKVFWGKCVYISDERR